MKLNALLGIAGGVSLAALSWAGTAQAALIAAESFNYPVGSSLLGQNGGTGWMGAWLGPNLGGGATGSDLPFMLTNGLSWTNGPGYIVGTGNAIFDADDGGPNHSVGHGDARQWFDPTTDITAAWGTNIWFSCLATYDVISTSGGIVVPFADGFQALSGIGITLKGGSGSIQVYIRQHGVEMSTNAVNYLQAPGSLTNVALVVGRFQLSPSPGNPVTDRGSDRLDVWLNQTREPTNNSALFMSGFATLRTFPFSQGYLVVRTGGNCMMKVDEIRIGTTFADVVPATAASDNPKPVAPLLSIEKAGPVGLQFNTAAGPTNHYNEIETAAGIECSWVGYATPTSPATYWFSVTNPPAPGATNFQAYVWLIPSPNGFIAAERWNPNVVRLAIESDAQGAASATLGYKTDDPSGTTMFLGSGFLCGITNAPFAGRWTISLTNDTDFILTAPNGTQATGSMPNDVPGAFFQNQVHFFLGVNPQRGHNLGRFITVSEAGVGITNASVICYSDFTKSEPLDAAKWSILADDPASIIVIPSNSAYRATWRNASGAGVGPNALMYTSVLGGAWQALPPGSVLGNSTNVVFITRDFATNSAGCFRVSIPYSPY